MYQNKIKKALKDGGLKLLIKRGIRLLYRKFKHFLPYSYGEYNGVKAASHNVLESKIDIRRRKRPDYESGLINGLKNHVKKDDKIVILGGGFGITAVKAANFCKPGTVHVFEASKSQLDRIRRTLDINNVNNVELHQAIVGKEVDVWGSASGSKIKDPENLPKCDVLEMDIEGAELTVIKNLKIRPRVIIVETHGKKGSPTKKVQKSLEKLNYSIVDISLAENKENFRDNDIRVITAIRN